MKATVVGGGVIGAGWAARFLLNGWDVSVYDLDMNISKNIYRVIENARLSLPSLYNNELPIEGKINISNLMENAIKEADWVQECVPERLDVKKEVLQNIQSFASENAVIASSTSGFKPSQLQAGAIRPERILVCHPFHPVYLLPLVEVVGSDITLQQVSERAIAILKSIGMKPLKIRKEIEGHVADRLIEALWREALWLIHDDIATTEEVDDAMRFAMGIRYALMGVFEHYRLAGGESGIRHALQQFGPSLKWPWTKLTDVPELTVEFIDKICNQSDHQSKGHSIAELERSRDKTLVGIIRVMRETSRRVGVIINEHDKLLKTKQSKVSGLILTLGRQVPETWGDDMGNMTEKSYLESFSQATKSFLELIGVTQNYIARQKQSYIPIETYLQYVDKIKVGEKIFAETQILHVDSSEVHLLHWLKGMDGRLAATGEHILRHCTLSNRAACPPNSSIMKKLSNYLEAQSNYKMPERVKRITAP